MENQIFSVNAIIIEEMSAQSGVSVGGKSWAKKDVLVETIEKYPKKIAMTIWNDLIDLVKINVKAKIGFYVEAKEWNGKWYNNLSLRSIYYDDEVEKNNVEVSSQLDRETAKFGTISQEFTKELDDLPF